MTFLLSFVLTTLAYALGGGWAAAAFVVGSIVGYFVARAEGLKVQR